MTSPPVSSLTRLGILALPVSGVLALGGVIGRYNIPNPRTDAEAAARAAASMGYFVSQLVGNVLGLTVLIFGILALTAYLAQTRSRRLAVAAMIFTIAGLGPVLSVLGVTTYALPALGEAYLSGQQDAIAVIRSIFHSPWRIFFVFVFLSYAAGFVLFGVAIWRSGTLRKGAAISLGIHAPLVSSFIRPEPSPAVLLGGALFILGGVMISLDVIRGSSARKQPRRANGDERSGTTPADASEDRTPDT